MAQTGLNNRTLFSHVSGCWKSTIKVSAGLISPWLTDDILLCDHLVFPLCVHAPGVSLCVLISFSYEDTSQIELWSTLTIYLMQSPLYGKGPNAKYSHILRP